MASQQGDGPRGLMVHVGRKPFYKNRNLMNLYLLMIPGTLVVSATMGYDSSMMNGIQAVEKWNKYFGYPTGSLLGIMNAILPLGSVFGTPLAAFVSDRYGRRWAMTVGDLIMIAGAAIQTGSINIEMFLISRFIIGFGLTIASGSAPTLTTELAHPSSRATITAMYNTLWYLGSIIAAWSTYGTYRMRSDWSWRLPALLQVVPCLINLLGCWFIPESPRWLIGQERYDEAKAILMKYHGEDDDTSALVDAEYREIVETVGLELSLGKRGWGELIRTPGNRYRTFIVLCCAYFPQWSGAGLVSYYLAPVLRSIEITSQERITLINGILQIWNMIVSMTGANLVDKLGRRKIFLGATSCMFVGMIGWTIAGSQYVQTKSDASGIAVLFCICFFLTSYNFCWNPLAVAYPCEVLTFPIRAKGVSLLIGAIKSASFFNQFVNPIGLKNLKWKFYIVYCCWLSIVLAVIYFLFPETKGIPLEEIALIFDKDLARDSEKEVENRAETIEDVKPTKI